MGLQKTLTADDGRCRTVSDGSAHGPGQRIGDKTVLQDLLHGLGEGILGKGVQGGIVVGLGGGSDLVHGPLEIGMIKESLFEEAGQVYDQLMGLRLAHQARCAEQGRPPDNELETAELTNLEEALLRQAFSQMGNLQKNSLHDLIFAPQQVRFGYPNSDALSAYCRQC